MKTKIFTALALLFSTTIFAQQMTHTESRTTFGVSAGLNFFNVTGKYADGTKLDNGIKTGFDLGVNAEIPLGTGSYLQPGLLYSQKGAVLKMIPNSSNLRLNYLEVPVNYIYKPVLGTGRLLLGVGPYLGFGIGGNLKNANGTKTDVVFTNSYNDTDPRPQFRRVDYGGNLLAGYEFSNNFSFQLNAQLGLADIQPDQTGSNKNKQNNTGFGVSVGYRF